MSKAGDPRIAELLRNSSSEVMPDQANVAILGYPCDIGVERNKGRLGSILGPRCFRKKFSALGPLINPEFGVDISKINLVDQGDIPVSDSLEDNHAALTEKVQSLLAAGFIVVVIGGGNDQSYCNAKGLLNSAPGSIGVVNIDAHLDVRPLIEGHLAHSGSPFRQLLEDTCFQSTSGSFCEFAAQGNQCSLEHTKYVREKGGEVIWLSQLRKSSVIKEFDAVLASFSGKDVFISFDIDSIRGSDCPGVSCPAVIGLSAQEALDICFAAGKHSRSRLLDISEYNPLIEEDRTGRLVVNMVYYFLLGVAAREP